MSGGRILGHNVAGLFQQYIAVDESAVDQGLVLPVQNCVPPICGALIEPLGAVIYSHELVSRIAPDLRSVAVFGAGPIGLLSAVYLNGLGARALLVHPSQERLNTATALELIDAASTITVSDNLTEQLVARNGGKHFDAALICTTRQGAPGALRHAVGVVRSGGCIDMIANYPEAASAPEGIATDAIRTVRAANACGVPSDGEYVAAEISGRRIAFTGHRGTSGAHLLRATQLLQSSTSPYSRLITHVLSLRNAAGAIETLAGSQRRTLFGHDCIKAVINLSPLLSEF
jgi:threonine dehydrogenase-like Zn-dependent dehydrogenase